MKQRYTQSAASRNLKIERIWALSEEEAYQIVKTIRFADTFGRPVCSSCGCERVYEYRQRPVFKCSRCLGRFTVTSNTIWHHRRMTFKRLLLLTAYFVMNSHGRAANRIGRDMGLSPMAVFVAAHKMRQAMGSADAGVILRGSVEVDGCLIGGHVKKHNSAALRQKYGTPKNKAKQSVICVAREKRGRAMTKIVKHEKDFVDFVRERVAHDAIIVTDQGSHWERLGETFAVVNVINHSEHYWTHQASTNGAESYFGRVRLGQRGVYLKIADAHRDLYAIEQAWRTTNCRLSDAERYLQLLRLCLTHPVSRRFSGYWHRGRAR